MSDKKQNDMPAAILNFNPKIKVPLDSNWVPQAEAKHISSALCLYYTLFWRLHMLRDHIRLVRIYFETNANLSKLTMTCIVHITEPVTNREWEIPCHYRLAERDPTETDDSGEGWKTRRELQNSMEIEMEELVRKFRLEIFERLRQETLGLKVRMKLLGCFREMIETETKNQR